MALTQGLGFVGMVGIIDPLRAEAKGAVETALRAGIDVRMITGDHAVTAQAIGEQLGLGPGAISGSELEALSDDELARRLPELHVFGRVSPEDKLRLARTMQAQGLIVAMTGDAVNDAAALKQADIGVAMGSGSEVTKQAARMVLTDDNFGTLVQAVEIGRRVYDKIVVVRAVPDDPAARARDAVHRRHRLQHQRGCGAHPVDGAVPAVLRDGAGRGDHRRRPRRPRRDAPTSAGSEGADLEPDGDRACGSSTRASCSSRRSCRWSRGRTTPSSDHASASMTMTFAVMGLGTVFNALTNRRDPTSGLTAPILQAIGISVDHGRARVPRHGAAAPAGLPDDDVAHRPAVARGDRARLVVADRRRGVEVDPASACAGRRRARPVARREPGASPRPSVLMKEGVDPDGEEQEACR